MCKDLFKNNEIPYKLLFFCLFLFWIDIIIMLLGNLMRGEVKSRSWCQNILQPVNICDTQVVNKQYAMPLLFPANKQKKRLC